MLRSVLEHRLRRRFVVVEECQVSWKEEFLFNVAETTGPPIERLLVLIISLLHNFHDQLAFIVHASPLFTVIIVIFVIGDVRIVFYYALLLLHVHTPRSRFEVVFAVAEALLTVFV